jgi:hypothetical protein
MLIFLMIITLSYESFLRRNCESPSAYRDSQFLGATVLNTEVQRKSCE